MDIGKVLTMARQLKNHFRVFEELDEFMREAVALQNVVKEFETRKAGLQQEIEVLKHEKAEVGTATAKFKEEKKKQRDVLMQGLEADYQERKKEIEADLSSIISTGEARKNKLKEELEQMETIHADTLKRMEEETARAEETLRAVEKKIRDIKAKLE